MEKIMFFGLALWMSLMISNGADKPSTPSAKPIFSHSIDKPVKIPVTPEFKHSIDHPNPPNKVPVKDELWRSPQ